MKNTKEIHERERGRRESSNGQPNKPMSNPSDNLPLSLQSFLAALEHGKLRTLALRNLADCLLLHGLDLNSVSPNLQLGIPRCRMLSFSCLLNKHKCPLFCPAAPQFTTLCSTYSATTLVGYALLRRTPQNLSTGLQRPEPTFIALAFMDLAFIALPFIAFNQEVL